MVPWLSTHAHEEQVLPKGSNKIQWLYWGGGEVGVLQPTG